MAKPRCLQIHALITGPPGKKQGLQVMEYTKNMILYLKVFPAVGLFLQVSRSVV